MDDSGGSKPYQRVDHLEWTKAEQQQGKVIKIKGFPAEHKVKVFRVVLSTQRTDYVVTNEMAQDNVEVVRGSNASRVSPILKILAIFFVFARVME